MRNLMHSPCLMLLTKGTLLILVLDPEMENQLVYM